jgi:putative urate catabolism protein
MSREDYPRDLVGYGREPPDPRWPDAARIAVSFVINYEEGGEHSILHGDAASETLIAEAREAQPVVGGRDFEVESLFEYGSRAGFWRLMRLFEKRSVPVTFYAVSMALERNPAAARAMVDAGHEIASHGYRWIEYYESEQQEREDLLRSIEAQTRVAGSRPVGWYAGKLSPFTRQLLVEEGGFLYDSDAYSDDLPYWDTYAGRPHLIIPYSLETNDWQFDTPHGFSSGEAFFGHLKDAFDVLYEEGSVSPKMMSVGLHCRYSGRPAWSAALARFVDHVQAHGRVWVCRRADIARHWHKHHPHR